MIGFVTLPYGFVLRFFSMPNVGERKEVVVDVNQSVIAKVKGKGEEGYLWLLFKYFVLPYAVVNAIKYAIFGTVIGLEIFFGTGYEFAAWVSALFN